MRAITATEPGGPETLSMIDAELPNFGEDDLLVKVEAAGVNRADINQREGNYPPPLGVTEILGLESAGEVVEVGSSVTDWSPGDKVCAILPGGGYAEFVSIPAGVALPWPDGMSAVEAASVYETFATSYDNLFNRARLATGETVLIHGGSSGVGTAAIQLAKRAGCRVIVTVGNELKASACLELGADAAINYKSQDFVEEVHAFTDGKGVDVILDVVGGGYLERNMSCIGTEGRLAIIALMGGTRAEIDLAMLMVKRLSVSGSTLRARPLEDKAALARQLLGDVWPGFSDGTLRPVIDSTFALSAAAAAHIRMESSEHIGKIVLTLP